jgi:hypothetical protein
MGGAPTVSDQVGAIQPTMKGVSNSHQPQYSRLA